MVRQPHCTARPRPILRLCSSELLGHAVASHGLCLVMISSLWHGAKASHAYLSLHFLSSLYFPFSLFSSLYSFCSSFYFEFSPFFVFILASLYFSFFPLSLF